MIRFAVIGTNTITDKFLQAASALPDFKLCACDRCHHGFVVERHEHRCQQLHVRKHPCDEG